MLWTIVRREITANILSFRFLMGLLIYFSLILTNLFVLTRGYEDRLQSYRTALRENEDQIGQVKKYSEFGQIGQTRRLKCNRKPKLLSIFNEGVDKRKGNSVTVAHGSVPAVAEQHGSDKLYRTGSPSDQSPKIEVLRMWADYLNERADAKGRFDDAHLDKQFAQVGFTQQITRLSPAAIYKYALESLAGTGFTRHKRFVQQARRYRKQFVDFIQSEDRADNESYHVYLVKEGLSQKPVAFNSIPKFSEKLTVGITFKGALLDLMLLLSLSLLLFMGAVLAFLRSDIK